jgi:hypothetical protein
MSRLAHRVRQLESRLGPCPDCRGATIELRYAGESASRPAIAERCRTCVEPLRRITVLVAFDPDAAEAR